MEAEPANERPGDGVPIAGRRRRARRENYGMERSVRERRLRAVLFLSLLPFLAAAVSLALYVATRLDPDPNQAAAALDGNVRRDGAGQPQPQAGDVQTSYPTSHSTAHEHNSSGATAAEAGLITTSTSLAIHVPTQYSNGHGQAVATTSAELGNDTGAELGTSSNLSAHSFSGQLNSTSVEQKPTHSTAWVGLFNSSTSLADSTTTTMPSKTGKPTPETFEPVQSTTIPLLEESSSEKFTTVNSTTSSSIQTTTNSSVESNSIQSSWVNAAEYTPTSTLALATGLSNPFPYPLPAVRYREWSTLERTTRMIAAAHLDYTRTRWNVHGYAPIERKGWSQLDPYERQGATQIGFDEDAWDCFINHYGSMTWDELDQRGVAGSYEALGWTRTDWDGGIRPASDWKYWGHLTDAEKVAATGLCYFEDNWDGIDMHPNPSYFPHPLPEFRFVPWRELSSKTRSNARKWMKYNQRTWDDFEGGAEDRDFFNLDLEERRGAEDIGFYPHTWNCYVNHYSSFSFDEFYGNLNVAVKALGWDRENWDNNSPYPASNDKSWSELSPKERAGATMMCYFAELWDGISITHWYDYENSANTAVSAEATLPGDIDMSIFEEK